MSKETFDPTRYNPSNNEAFASVLAKHLSRRGFIKRGSGFAALTAFTSLGITACGSDSSDSSTSSNSDLTSPEIETPTSSVSLGFESVPGSKIDAAVIPEGYRAQVLAPWGTPLNSQAAPWKDDGTNTATDQLNSVGQHHDGMHFFPLGDATDDGLLCINHEYLDTDALHPETGRQSLDDVRKEVYAHGVTVVRIKKDSQGVWSVVEDDAHNRRITADSLHTMAGPLSGSDLLVTKFTPDGTKARGTINNCGNGYTPWGTYITCEENWPGYFVDTGSMSEANTRLGISTSGTRYGWEEFAGMDGELEDEFARFDITASGATAAQDYRNEANAFGYLVEIDPYSAQSLPVKRTAMGRIRHENCTFGKLEAGKPLTFYTGHDSRFEYLYKYVSDTNWDEADALDANSTAERLAIGSKYLDQGTLYVAKFSEDGVGTWLPLTLDATTADGGTLADHFANLEAIILNTPGAADLVGATPMDRPEWCTVDPITGTVYLTLTNNTNRTEANPANPRLDNAFGHIIRWDEGDSVTDFTWDIFLFGAPDDGDADTNRSGLTDLNQFASPDGLAFDGRGILWVQTDNGASEVTEDTNDQMLAIVPSKLVDENNNPQVVDASNQAELKRFFVGPNGCEVTGVALSPDYKAIFANIQHPDNWPYSDDAAEQTPAGMQIRPRAATIVFSKLDGGEVGV